MGDLEMEQARPQSNAKVGHAQEDETPTDKQAPRGRGFKKWILSHKIETTAFVVIVLAVIVICAVVFTGSDESPTVNATTKPVDGNVGDVGVDTGDTGGDTTDPSGPDPNLPNPILKTAVMKALEEVTDPEILHDETSPQFKAAEWIIALDKLKLEAEDPSLLQRYALATLYFATGGGLTSSSEGWPVCGAIPSTTNEGSNMTSSSSVQCLVRDGKVVCARASSFESCTYTDVDGFEMETKRFLSAADACEWYGIQCDGGEVSAIDIANNELNGSLPKELKLLTGLTKLNLHSNNIEGEIPSELGELKEMVQILLYSNKLKGLIPPELYELAYLEHFEVFENDLEGELSPAIGTWKEMKVLSLYENRFSGPLPKEMALMEYVQRIDLQHNEFSGVIPVELGTLWYLESLKLDHNNFKGAIPEEVCDIGIPILEADCLADVNGDTELQCYCCTKCCTGDSGVCDPAGNRAM